MQFQPVALKLSSKRASNEFINISIFFSFYFYHLYNLNLSVHKNLIELYDNDDATIL